MEGNVRRRHDMPFGAQLTRDGGVRFRLWAPRVQEVQLLLCESGAALPMSALAGGWFELETGAASAGTLYRYRLDGGAAVADPAARFNPQGVHGPSMVIDPASFQWDDANWRPPPWETSVVYELHVGTFSAAGTFAAASAHLEHLVELGVTAIELMPVASFPGTRGWGYDGVLLYAPQPAYGTPAQLKSLIAAAHGVGLAVVLDVVYNHFGPEGNYLHQYAPQFFTERHHTPWGAALNFDGPDSRAVRDFFIHNALYWLEEYHIDGLRLDAIHAVYDAGEPHIVAELARAARRGPGHARPVYLTLENFDNGARLLGAGESSCDAQWNDDFHHCLHVLLTGETQDYYADYAQQPQALLCRTLTEGFAYQGEASAHAGAPRGEASAHLPPSAFIHFLQNHDQVGNRARGERITALVRDPAAVRAASALLLLAPSPPLLFMGEEWAAAQPFPWFCDFEAQLAATVFTHRQREFPGSPDPGDPATFASARLDWGALAKPQHRETLAHYRQLLAIRRLEIAPLLKKLRGGGRLQAAAARAFAVEWRAGPTLLRVIANLDATPADLSCCTNGRVLFDTHSAAPEKFTGSGALPAWSVRWLLESADAGA
jgi:maltooligosyltrehalose trehalohydrolase